jgi:hypothetical protein
MSTPVLILAVCVTCAGKQSPAKLGPIGPRTIVVDLYRRGGLGEQSPFYPHTRALADRYFAKGLADLIWRNVIYASKHPDLVPPMDNDPLYNEPDPERINFAIHNATYHSGRAHVVVSYERYCACRLPDDDRRQHLIFTFVRRKGEWKIVDLKYTDGSTLAGILANEFATDYKDTGKEP